MLPEPFDCASGQRRATGLIDVEGRAIEQLRRVTTFLPVRGDPASLRDVFRRDAGLWLHQAERLDDERWTFPVRGAGLTRTVLARVGAPWSSSNTLWRTFSWEPTREPVVEEVPPRWLPTFDGELGLITTGSDASLVLEGGYQPPGGAIGAALDGLALRRVAKATVDRLVADIAGRLVEQAATLHPTDP